MNILVLKGLEKHAANRKDLLKAVRKRGLYSDKYSNGKVIIIGGSSSYHGAPALASMAASNTIAALRTGAGYAITCVPKSIALAVRKTSPNIIVKALSGKNLNAKDFETLMSVSRRSNAIVIGPGLGREKGTLKTIARFIDYTSRAGKRIVIDADALYAISSTKRLNKNVLITPNTHEFGLFYNDKIDQKDFRSRLTAAMTVANRLNVNVLLKGHETIITDGRRYKTVEAETPALATMGTGDVLAGIIGGLAARNKDMFVPAVAGAYLHASIGDVLYKDNGDHIIATDVVDLIPKTMKRQCLFGLS